MFCENAGWLAPVELEPKRKKVREKRSSLRASNKGCVFMSLPEYLELLDWTDRPLSCELLTPYLSDTLDGPDACRKFPAVQPTNVSPTNELRGIGRQGLLHTSQSRPTKAIDAAAATAKRLTSAAQVRSNATHYGIG